MYMNDLSIAAVAQLDTPEVSVTSYELEEENGCDLSGFSHVRAFGRIDQRAERFLVRCHRAGVPDTFARTTVKVLEFKRPPSWSQQEEWPFVHATAARLQLKRMDIWDVLRFCERYPEAHRASPLVFNHEPRTGPDGHEVVLMARTCARENGLTLTRYNAPKVRTLNRRHAFC